ncbi:MAG: tetratricopeptide repeat protein [Candidatus Eisenbacteria bacterium]
MRKCALLIVLIAVVMTLFGASPGRAGVPRELEYAEKLMREGLTDLAKKELERLLESRQPASVRQEASLLLGDISFARSDFEGASRLYARAYEASPKGEDACTALYKVCDSSFMMGRYSEAAAGFRRLAQLFPECSLVCTALVKAARSYLEVEDRTQAARQLEEVLAECEDREAKAQALFWLGKAYLPGSPKRAREVLESVLAQYPGTEIAFRSALEVASILESQGDSRGALASVERVLSYRVDGELRARAILKKARLLVLFGRDAEAARSYADCLAATGDSALAEHCGMSAQHEFLRAGKPAEAEAVAEKLMSRRVSESALRTSLFTRARVKRLRGAPREALRFLERMDCGSGGRGGDSLCCAARIEEGRIKETLSDYDGASASYRAALMLQCGDSLKATALSGLAALEERRDRVDDAVSHYSTLLTLYPKSRSCEDALYRLAQLYEKRGDYSQAAGAYTRLRRDFPLGPTADEATRRAEALTSLFPPSIVQKDLKKLSGLVASAVAGLSPGYGILEQSASTLEEDFRYFEEAVSLLDQALAIAPPERKAVVLFRLSNVHWLLSKRLAFEGKTQESTAHRSVGLRILSDIRSSYATSERADDASFLLMQDELERLGASDRPSRAASAYTDFLRKYPETDRFEEALLGRARALVELSLEPGDAPYAEALATYGKLIQEFPRSSLLSFAYCERGEMLRRAQDLGAAARDFRAVLAGYAGSDAAAQAAFGLGECELALRELNQAISHYDMAFEKAKEISLRQKALARKGDCLFLAGRLSEAVALYEHVLVSDPTGPFADDLLAKEAEAYLGTGMLEEASQALARLTRDFPRSPLVRNLLLRKAQAEVSLGQFVGAAASFRELESRFPESRADTVVLLGLGEASYRTGDFRASYEAYERALTFDLGPATRARAARASVMALVRAGEDSRAGKRLKWYQKNFPADTTLVVEFELERGLAEFEAGNVERAYARLSGIVQSLPREPRLKALVTMGLCMLKSQDLTQAAAHFGDACSLAAAGGAVDSSLVFTARFKLGTSLYGLSRYEEASKAYVEASLVCPDSSSCCEAWYNSALCLERAEGWLEASRLYDRVATECTGRPAKEAAFKAGYCLLNTGEKSRALEYLERALRTADEEDKREVQYWIAEAYAVLGQFERAASEFLKVPYLYGEGSLWAVTARYKAGLAFEAAGDRESAAKQYKILVEREGDRSEWGRLAKERLENLSR